MKFFIALFVLAAIVCCTFGQPTYQQAEVAETLEGADGNLAVDADAGSARKVRYGFYPGGFGGGFYPGGYGGGFYPRFGGGGFGGGFGGSSSSAYASSNSFGGGLGSGFFG
ncbi:keratin, type I cytoskeletal 10-like [Musca vetustissima]|uniref:keratin, type I cytoskeletal 10-like n=1 Tax=Musca vetustissima TaxID=27455 RepID=UPI002AB7307F|nr:keratin, type I cytoskeletal 10-like [Musca vetustissima]